MDYGDTFHMRAHRIAGYLGDEWIGTPGHLGNGADARLTRLDGATVWLNLIHRGRERKRETRISVSPIFGACESFVPNIEPGRATITISPNKSDEQIASDIQKRLLPSYLTAYEKAYARQLEWDEHMAERSAFEQRLGAIIGADKPGHTSYWLFGGIGRRGQFRITGGAVEMKFELPHNEAEHLLRFAANLTAA